MELLIKKQAELAKDQEKKLKQIQDELYNKIKRQKLWKQKRA